MCNYFWNVNVCCEISDQEMSVFSNDCGHSIESFFHDRGGSFSIDSMFIEKGFAPSQNHLLIQTFILRSTSHLTNHLNSHMVNTIPNHTMFYHFDIHIRTNYSIWRVEGNSISSYYCCSSTCERMLFLFCSLQNEIRHTATLLPACVYTLFRNLRVGDSFCTLGPCIHWER